MKSCRGTGKEQYRTFAGARHPADDIGSCLAGVLSAEILRKTPIEDLAKELL